ncbi:MAG: polysaccharide deacetylase family protein [Aristaeellaceae bacterium]
MRLIMRFPGDLGKALTFSYDDGVEQDAELIRILDAHGMKGTFNLNSGLYAPEGHKWPATQVHRRMSREACKALYGGSGHEVAVHCLTHASLPELPLSAMVSEIMQDRKNLEADFGGIIRGMAYPFGTYSDDAVEALRSCGMLYARTVISTHRFNLPQNLLLLPATCHHDDPLLMSLADRFLTESTVFASKLFYLWGHSYEFEEKNNWDVISAFCDKMAGRPEIWYATNGEIFTYMEAWRQIQISADGMTVYNPTATRLWFECEGKHYVLAPGETLRVEG